VKAAVGQALGPRGEHLAQLVGDLVDGHQVADGKDARVAPVAGDPHVGVDALVGDAEVLGLGDVHADLDG
jgi:hypothetical protein